MRLGQEVQALPRTGRLNETRVGAATGRADALAWLADLFANAGVEEPRREARIALCQAAGLRPAALIAWPEAALGEAAASRLVDVARRRAAGEPLSRIAGQREFWGLALAIAPDVLDPRSDTETPVSYTHLRAHET